VNILLSAARSLLSALLHTSHLTLSALADAPREGAIR
jgi:hypothetical protein